METPKAIYNWSLQKLLSTEHNSFEGAKIKILYIVILFALLKASVAIGVTWYFDQYFQLMRAVAILLIFTGLLKLLLTNRKFLGLITHAMITTGLMLIWSSAFLYAQTLNVLTIQFICMLTLSSFYLLELRSALIYSILGSLPVLLQMLFKEHFSVAFMPSGELASPGYEILAILNFITLILSHYLFRQAFIENVAEKAALNTQLQSAVKEANKAAESKSDFLSTMSHELRTPLNSVIGITELLLNDAHSKEQEENLSILKFSASNLHTLINDILDFNKLESGKLELEAISVEIDKLFQDISMGLRFQATQKRIDFKLDIDETLVGRRVVTDPTRLTQVIYNLAGNAVKFTEKGGVTIKVRCLELGDEDIKLNVAITDTGIGISKEKRESIFEPFTQASSSTTRNFGGTGLGLAIVKQLLLLYNSEIRVDSTPGVGSTFSFDLSLKQDPIPLYLHHEKSEELYDLGGLRILVAEDTSMNRILLSKIFSNWNCVPVFAENGKEAVNKVAGEEFDVVLMDLHMPVMDGYEAARTIRKLDALKSDIPILALTASVSPNLNEKTRAAGMDGFILKPFKMNDLYSKLKEISSPVSATL